MVAPVFEQVNISSTYRAKPGDVITKFGVNPLAVWLTGNVNTDHLDTSGHGSVCGVCVKCWPLTARQVVDGYGAILWKNLGRRSFVKKTLQLDPEFYCDGFEEDDPEEEPMDWISQALVSLHKKPKARPNAYHSEPLPLP